MSHFDTLIDQALLSDGRRVRIGITQGRIAAVEDLAAAFPATATEQIDAKGELLLPALFDGHIHLDLALLGLPWMPHAAGPDRLSRIETDKHVIAQLPLPTHERAANLIRRCATFGTGHLRSHVNIDVDSGLSRLEEVIAARDACRGYADVQLVAFPQSGVIRDHGTEQLLDAAMERGADLVGGIDPCSIDHDPRGQLDAIFGVADRHDAGLDIHLHEPGELGLFDLHEICVRTQAFGLGGRVTISHGFCLGDVTERKAREAADLMARAGVMLATHGAASSGFPPLALLREHGVNVFAGNDNIRDTWNPSGTGDMLERISIIGWRADFRRDEQVMTAYELATTAAARAFGTTFDEIAVGAPANFYTIAATCVPEAIGSHPPRSLVFHQGRLIARQGQLVDSRA